MRLIDVVLAAVLLALIVGFLHTMPPNPASANAQQGVSERITWLWTPAMARRSSVR